MISKKPARTRHAVSGTRSVATPSRPRSRLPGVKLEASRPAPSPLRRMAGDALFGTMMCGGVAWMIHAALQ
jgi:hypothetical protein